MARKRRDVAIVPRDPAGVVAKLQEGEKIDLQELAQGYTVESMNTLLRAQRSRKASWNAKISAANSVLDHGHGRANTRETERNPGGITVVINQLSTGGQTESLVTAQAIAKLEADAQTIEAEFTPGTVTVNLDDLAQPEKSG